MRASLTGALLALVVLFLPWGVPRAQEGQEVGRTQGRPIPAERLFTIEGTPGVPFREPTDVVVSSTGRIYVLDGLNSRVAVFDAGGRHLSSFGSAGSAPGQLWMAVGMGIAPDGRIYVADTGNHRVQIFTPDGAFLRAFGLKRGETADPTDVLPSSVQNYCYVCDNDNHEVQVYDVESGRFLFGWGGRGSRVGEFQYPATLAMDSRQDLYVVDVLNARVQSFDHQGKQGWEMVSWGVNPAGLFRPKGVAVDRARRILVSDSYMGEIKVYQNSGEFVGIVEGAGALLPLTTPTSIATAGDRLYVVEMRANRVSVLRWLP